MPTPHLPPNAAGKASNRHPHLRLRLPLLARRRGGLRARLRTCRPFRHHWQ